MREEGWGGEGAGVSNQGRGRVAAAGAVPQVQQLCSAVLETPSLGHPAKWKTL